MLDDFEFLKSCFDKLSKDGTEEEFFSQEESKLFSVQKKIASHK
jgi:hypothetical protein